MHLDVSLNCIQDCFKRHKKLKTLSIISVESLSCLPSSSDSVWDDGYPSGGNYWSDYVGVDLFSGPYQNITGCDGIGDTPILFRDRYPLMHPWPPFPADINRDGKIDGKDIAVVAKAFGSYPGHPRWNPQADLNQGNKIEGKDIAKVAKNFGKTYP